MSETLTPNDDILRTFFYAGLFKPELCQRVFQEAIWDPELTRNHVDLQARYAPGFENYRAKDIQVLAHEEANQWIRVAMLRLLKTCNTRHFQFEAEQLSEVQLLTLKAGEKMDWHYHVGLGPLAMRKVCLTLVLSDEKDYTGGSFHSIVGTREQPQGTAIVHASIATVCTQTVTQGELKLLFATLDGHQPLR